MKITNLAQLKAEKVCLQKEAENISASLAYEFKVIERAIQPGVLVQRAVSALIPNVLKKSKITGVPINFIFKAVFGEKPGISKVDPTSEKRQRMKNIALNVLESVALVFLSKGIKRF